VTLFRGDVRNNLLDLSNETQIHRHVITSSSKMINQISASQLITKACRMIIDRRGNISVNELTIELPCSTRYLQKLFKLYVGLSPKELIVIIKLRESIDDIAYPQKINNPKLTQLALNNQFYDHFTNTFRSIAGTTPKQFNPRDYLLSLKK